MRKEQRIRRRRDFDAAYRKGTVHGNPLLVLRVRPNGGETSRFGFVVSKAVGGAVVRNQVKRRLRAAADSLAVRPGLDVVIGARKSAADVAYGPLLAALTLALKRAKALEGAPAAVETV